MASQGVGRLIKGRHGLRLGQQTVRKGARHIGLVGVALSRCLLSGCGMDGGFLLIVRRQIRRLSMCDGQKNVQWNSAIAA